MTIERRVVARGKIAEARRLVFGYEERLSSMGMGEIRGEFVSQTHIYLK